MPVEQLIYTDRPRGQGVDPNCGGYQIKACSPNLSADARRRLESICRHYGAVVYEAAPRAARDKEQQWRAQATSLNEVPEAVLAEFPVIWSYDQLADEQFALTRIGYRGLTHDGRLGNFFAHALIFSPLELSVYGFNPLTLARSALFRARDDSDAIELPVLPGLDGGAIESSAAQTLRSAPYHQHLPELLRGLCDATPAERPVVLGVAKWSEGIALVEALLDLLPPAARCRTTISTYEGDRQWIPPTATGSRPANQSAAHHLLVLSSPETRPFNLRPDEYQKAFAAFNFVDEKFSEWTTPESPYVKFALDCLNTNKLDQLQQHHELVETLGVGQEVQAWSILVCAAQLRNPDLAVRTLPAIVQALLSVAQQPAQAHQALDLLLPHVGRLAAADDARNLGALSSDLSELANRVARDEEINRSQTFLSTVLDLAGEALTRGQGRTVSALLQTCGAARKDYLLSVLDGALSDEQLSIINPAADAADHRAIFSLLVDGLTYAAQQPDYATVLDQWLVVAFRTATEARLLPELWARTGDQLVKPRLSGEWSADIEQLLRALLAHTSAEQCGAANAWLNLRLLTANPPQGAALLTQLKELASACAHSDDGAALASEVIRQGLAQFPEAEHEARAETLAQMSETVSATAPGDVFFQAYLEESRLVAPQQFQLRRKLAAEGVLNVLCRELIAEVLPWDEEQFQLWWNELLRRDKRLLDTVRRGAAAQLRSSKQSDDGLALAEALLPDKPEPPVAGSGLGMLYEAIALRLPLAPIMKRWAQVLNQVPEGRGRARLRVMSFMRDVERQAQGPDWSVLKFPHTQQAWSSDLKSLTQGDKEEALSWCLDQFIATGVPGPGEAQSLVRILAATGAERPEQIAEAIMDLLYKRDAVTCVNAVMAFALCALEGTGQRVDYGSIVNAILDRSDRKTRILFEDHLLRRFAPDDPNYQRRLGQFCDVLGIAKPKSVEPAPRAAAAEGGGEESAGWSNVTGILGSAKRSWRKLLGGADDKTQSGQGRKDE